MKCLSLFKFLLFQSSLGPFNYLLEKNKEVECGIRGIRIRGRSTGNPGSVILSHYGFIKITVFVWGKSTTLKFVGNTE